MANRRLNYYMNYYTERLPGGRDGTTVGLTLERRRFRAWRSLWAYCGEIPSWLSASSIPPNQGMGYLTQNGQTGRGGLRRPPGQAGESESQLARSAKDRLGAHYLPQRPILLPL